MEAYKREFIQFLEGAGVLKFGDFTAKSGRKIPYFINAGDIKTGDQICTQAFRTTKPCPVDRFLESMTRTLSKSSAARHAF